MHEIRSGYWGRLSDVRDAYDNAEKCMQRIIEFYIKNTKLSSDDLKEKLRRDCEWSSDECLEFGIVDELSS